MMYWLLAGNRGMFGGGAGFQQASGQAQGWQRLNVPAVYAPFAEGGFPTPSGKCEFYSDTAWAMRPIASTFGPANMPSVAMSVNTTPANGSSANI